MNLENNITEATSRFDHLEEMPISELLKNINKEDSTIHIAVEKTIPVIEELVGKLVTRMKNGGRLFYLGSGTSGRLGILDASEIPPTFGLSYGKVIGLIAGGDSAIRKAIESAEDDSEQAWKELQEYDINENDTVIGIAASGKTPYVIGGVKTAKENGILTACVTCNPDSPLSQEVDIPIEAIVGPEFVTGSTRMKAGTAQKMVLNMITTSTMIKLGRVKGNKMVDMQLTNKKLVIRGTKMIQEEINVSEKEAKELLLKHGSVREAVYFYKK